MKRFFILWGVGFSLFLSLLLICAVWILGRGATRENVKYDMTRMMRRAENSLRGSRDIETDEDFSCVIVENDGDILFNAIPETFLTSDVLTGMLQHPSDYLRGLHTYSKIYFEKIEGAQYCIQLSSSRALAGRYNEDAVLIALLRVDYMNSIYHILSISISVIMLIVVIIMLLVLVLWNKSYTMAIGRIADRASKIGGINDFSNRLEPDKRYPELVILTDAHNRLLDRVESILSTQRDFGRYVSHELRTPTGIISAQCQILKEKTRDEADIQECLQSIERQTNRMRDLISQLLILSKLESTSKQEQEDALRLDELIAFVCSDIEENCETGLKISQDLDEMTVRANMTYLIILTQNLVNNAVKYGSSESPIEVTLKKKEDAAVLTVSDRGPGMNPDEIARIFDPFYRKDESRHVEGYGLGLTLAQQIATHYGGRITVTSEPGQGSKFTAELHVTFI